MKKKFEELYFQSTAPDRVDRVFKIYRTTALDQKLVKKTFKLVDETLRRRNLFEAGLLWSQGNLKKSKHQRLDELRVSDFRLLLLLLSQVSHNLGVSGVVILPVFSNSKKKKMEKTFSYLIKLPRFKTFPIFNFSRRFDIIVCKSHWFCTLCSTYVFPWWFRNRSIFSEIRYSWIIL